MTDYHDAPSIKARFACLFYEALVIIALLIVGMIIPYTLLGASTGIVASGRLLMGHSFIILLVYFAWQWLNGGQTLAMKTWKIRLISEDGHPLRPGQALFRYALAWVSTVFLGFGFFWALIDTNGHYFHDRIAGTKLITVHQS